MRTSKPRPVVDLEPVGSGGGAWRTWLFVLALLLLLGVGGWLLLSRFRGSNAPPRLSQATEVRSSVTQEGDSLDVVVDWKLTIAPAQGVAESVRVEVGLGDGATAQVSTNPAEQRNDTLRLPAPLAGETSTGYSCVSAVHHGRLGREECTPWQFVRPSAERARVDTSLKPKGAARETIRVARVVVQPGGLQVDPDVGGRCAAWQHENPTRSVWLEVNRRAVPECTGPNGKPTVAQFCAFAELEDGRRTTTRNSADNPYCERLFRDWSSQRIS
jgi:hypothetical protein